MRAKLGVVLDDQQHAIVRLDVVPVVAHVARWRQRRLRRSRRRAQPLARAERRGSPAGARVRRGHLRPVAAAVAPAAGRCRLASSRRGGADVALRQVEGEGAALARAAGSRISPPSRPAISRLIDRPRPVPPYLRLVVPSACWNASKMILCRCAGMPMPVSLTAKAITRSARFRISWSPAPALARDVDPQGHLPLFRELEGVGEQVPDHLLQPLRVGVDRAGQILLELDARTPAPSPAPSRRKLRST